MPMRKFEFPERVCVQALDPGHIEAAVHRYRYALAQRWVYGHVVDAACGTGYGSLMLASTPTVESVVGVDYDPESLWYAERQPGRLRVPPQALLDFCQRDLNDNSRFEAGDCLVSIETIEHLKDPGTFLGLAKQSFSRIILTTPIVPTKEHHKYHLHDFTREQLAGWFDGWSLLDEQEIRGRYWFACWQRGAV